MLLSTYIRVYLERLIILELAFRSRANELLVVAVADRMEMAVIDIPVEEAIVIHHHDIVVVIPHGIPMMHAAISMSKEKIKTLMIEKFSD